MKKIINGKKYDTETATLIVSGRHSIKDLYLDLYKKKTGEYFIHRYGLYAGDLNDILSQTLDEAQDFVETYANDKYEEIFGEVEE